MVPIKMQGQQGSAQPLTSLKLQLRHAAHWGAIKLLQGPSYPAQLRTGTATCYMQQPPYNTTTAQDVQSDIASQSHKQLLMRAQVAGGC